MSGDDGCGVDGFVPIRDGVVLPSTDLYDLQDDMRGDFFWCLHRDLADKPTSKRNNV